MRGTRVIFAAFIAIAGLMFVLQQAGAEPETHRVYLAMVTVAGPASQAGNSTPNAAISVAARAGLSCDGDETVPVGGARITVITDHSSRIAMTDATGYALFTATAKPAVIQIEWPVGFLPCPNSRPVVELPGGAGAVEFMAVAGH